MPAQNLRLSDRQLKGVKPASKDYVLTDGDGLQLRVRSNGSLLWNFNYREPVTKKRINIGFGTYPELSLANARKMAVDARELLAQGIDPKVQRNTLNEAKRAETEHTFENVATAWFELKKDSVTPAYAEDIWRSLTLHVFPDLKTTPLAKITAPMVIGLLRPIDARQIDLKVLADYAAHLRDVVGRGELAVSTAQNRISSVNRTMAALRGDQCVKLPSPSKALGMQRTGVRQSVPQGQDREQVKQIVDALCSCHQLRAAAIVLLARATGMRLREAILADLPRLSREAKYLGRINVQDGTKGGRAGASAPRWIAVDGYGRGALGFARQVSPAGSRNLLAPHESYLNVLQEIIRPARDVLHAHTLKGFHELRAAYACERYEQMTQHRAPINGGRCCQVDKTLDREARKQISYELGHGRIDVVAAYIGGRT